MELTFEKCGQAEKDAGAQAAMEATEPYHSTKEPYHSVKEPYHSAKEPYKSPMN